MHRGENRLQFYHLYYMPNDIFMSTASSIISDFIVLIAFTITYWIVPVILLYDAGKAVSFVSIYIYIYFNFF